MGQAIDRLKAAKRTGHRSFISTPNVNFLARVQWDDDFRHSLIVSDLVLADGMPIIWLCRLLGIPISERVAGSDLFDRLSGPPADGEAPVTVYFFGGREGAAEAAYKKLQSHGAGVRAVGFTNPGFGSVEDMSDPSVLAEINKAKPDFVVVSLGAVKGQQWILRTLKELDAPIVCHLGAVVDFVAGTVQRSPRWLQIVGLEWAYRISQDPGLWKRYASDGLVLFKLFCTAIVPQIVSNMVNRRSVALADLGHCDCAEEGADRRIAVQGAISHPDLASLRDACVWASEGKGDVYLDFGAATHLCLHAQGQLLLLLKAVNARNGAVKFRNLSKRLERRFRRSGLLKTFGL